VLERDLHSLRTSTHVIDKMDIGKTNAARPSNTSRMMIPKILMDVLKLKKITKPYH
jgi:hypothetical protein